MPSLVNGGYSEITEIGLVFSVKYGSLISRRHRYEFKIHRLKHTNSPYSLSTRNTRKCDANHVDFFSNSLPTKISLRLNWIHVEIERIVFLISYFPQKAPLASNRHRYEYKCNTATRNFYTNHVKLRLKSHLPLFQVGCPYIFFIK